MITTTTSSSLSLRADIGASEYGSDSNRTAFSESVGGRVEVDIGGQFVRGGNAKYLAPGSIIDLPNGAIDIQSMESSTHLVTLRLGVRVDW